MDNFQQATVAKQLGIEIDEDRLHEAEYDLELMMDIYDKVKSKPFIFPQLPAPKRSHDKDDGQDDMHFDQNLE